MNKYLVHTDAEGVHYVRVCNADSAKDAALFLASFVFEQEGDCGGELELTVFKLGEVEGEGLVPHVRGQEWTVELLDCDDDERWWKPENLKATKVRDINEDQ